MADFLEALDGEIAKLEAELRADLRYRRLLELQRVRALYSESHDDTPRGVSGSVRLGTTLRPGGAFDSGLAQTVKRHRRAASPERQRALDAARMYLENRKGPVPTRVLFEHIEDLGIEIPGEKPLNNLSAMLSNSPDFESHGRAGWTRAGVPAEPARQPSVFDMPTGDTEEPPTASAGSEGNGETG